MEKFEELFSKQIKETEARYKKSDKEKGNRAVNQKLGGDWRQVESPQRVLRRMVTMGLDDLAGSILGSEDVTKGVESNLYPGQQISLLERIIEENDLLSSRFLHIGSAVSRAVGRVLIRNRGKIVGYGTGFLISSRLLMTNNHVLENSASAGRSGIEFDFYERQNGQTGPTVLFELDPDTFFLTDTNLDFTIVAVEPHSSDGQSLADRGWISLIAESGKALIGEPVNIVQHPNGFPQQIVIKNNKITNHVGDFLHYEADTEPGSSGSPVFNMQWELAALHHSGVPRRNNQGKILLRDGTVWNGDRNTIDSIAWEANEGIRISSIVRFVKESLSVDNIIKKDLFEEVMTVSQKLIPISSTPTASDSFEKVTTSQSLVMDDDTLDRISPEETAAIIAELEDRSFEITQEKAGPGEVIVAEGDSWFDYSLAGLDIIDCLKKFFGYRIHNVAKGGDTLDNMAWGTGYNDNWVRKSTPLEETLLAVRKYKPRVVLLSGGGNDLAGSELLSFLNHKGSGLKAIRQPYTDFMLKNYFRNAFEEIIHSIWNIDSSINIITHGYGYAVPDGRAVVRFLGLSFVGPWLRPALTAKGYDNKNEREKIIWELIDIFNDMLGELANDDEQKRIHYINLRSSLKLEDWENELHLKNSAYRRVAGIFDKVIQSIK